jgi:16S rRNA (cytidine1402-2'-O)-methyltransferase
MSGPSGTLYLLPTPLAYGPVEDVLPAATIETARRLRYFLAENSKSARAFLKAVAHPQPVASLRIVEIGHAPPRAELDGWLAPLLNEAIDAGLVSEAGCPAVADPGAQLVDRAHALRITVRPLVGPCAILLALMGAGLNGQSFRFVGYLPQDAQGRAVAIKALERVSAEHDETQLFIETPYRNEHLFDTLLAVCSPDTRLHIAVDLTGTHEFVCTRPVAQWRAVPAAARPQLRRRPCVFALLAAPKQRRPPTA